MDMTIYDKPKPPDTRPYRMASDPGQEMRIVSIDGWDRVFRQVGWHGASGAFYALGEDPSRHEPGSFSPLWIVAHADRVELPDVEEPDLPSQAKPLCSHAYRPGGGVKGFYVCHLDPGHDGPHLAASGGYTWTAASPVEGGEGQGNG